jgi:hypothetical protein
VLTEVRRCFLQSLQANFEIVPETRSLSLPSISLSTHYFFNILPFNVIVI